MQKVVDINQREAHRQHVARAREMLDELTELIHFARAWWAEDDEWKLDAEQDSIDLVREQLDDVAGELDQEINLNTLSGWLRLARDIYRPRAVAVLEDEESVEHISTDTQNDQCGQVLLNYMEKIVQLFPDWPEDKKDRARAILVNYITYANQEQLELLLSTIGRPMT